VLKLIEQRWNLPPLGFRDASALSLGTALDFEQEPRTAPQYQVAPVLAGVACPTTAFIAPSAFAVPSVRVSTAEDEWGPLYDLAKRNGWSLP
jgi:hypothetical protein